MSSKLPKRYICEYDIEYMKPLLFQFKIELIHSNKFDDLYYDEKDEIVKLSYNLEKLAMNSTKPFNLGTKKAAQDGGEDQKATLFSH